MQNKKNQKTEVQLSAVQMVWLQSQHIFQNIEQNLFNGVKFYKNNIGVQIKLQLHSQKNDPTLLYKAKEQLLKIINNNQIRFMNTSLYKDLYIRISKEARKQFPKSYIIFLHYQTFENCCRKLNEKFSITSITPQLQHLRRKNPNFCFLIAQKNKINDIEKFTERILNSQVSCASTTFSHNNRKQQIPPYKRTMSVSSLRGSLSDHEEQYRLSLHTNVGQQQMFEVTEVTLINLKESQMDQVKRKSRFGGCLIHIQTCQGTYLNIKKKFYYANRLQSSCNPHIQPIYAYSMVQKNTNRWRLSLITNCKYRKLSELLDSRWLLSIITKIEIIVKVGKCLIDLHKEGQSYGDLNIDNVLMDHNSNVYLSCQISKDIPPHTEPFKYDVRQYLLLIYRIFTEMELSYDALMKKNQNKHQFCTLNHRCRNKLLNRFLNIIDKLFIGRINLQDLIRQVQLLLKQESL